MFRRARRQISLATLLVAVTLLCIALGRGLSSHRNRIRATARVVSAARADGSEVEVTGYVVYLVRVSGGTMSADTARALVAAAPVTDIYTNAAINDATARVLREAYRQYDEFDPDPGWTYWERFH